MSKPKIDDDYYKDDINLARKLISLKDSAENRGIHFDMSFAHLKRIMRRKTCYYTGRRLMDSGQNARSVERIDSNKGYTDDNTIIIASSVNKAKDDLTLEELKMMVKKIEKHKSNN